MIILASIMENEGSGIKDEFFTLYHGSNEEEEDEQGRDMGTYLMATKGIMYFGGPTVTRLTYKWNHVCVSVEYTDEGAERTIVPNDGDSFNFTSEYLQGSKWPRDRNFTFGGEETYYYGAPLEGYMTDIQIFSRILSHEEMEEYTLCNLVTLEIMNHIQ